MAHRRGSSRIFRNWAKFGKHNSYSTNASAQMVGGSPPPMDGRRKRKRQPSTDSPYINSTDIMQVCPTHLTIRRWAVSLCGCLPRLPRAPCAATCTHAGNCNTCQQQDIAALADDSSWGTLLKADDSFDMSIAPIEHGLEGASACLHRGKGEGARTRDREGHREGDTRTGDGQDNRGGQDGPPEARGVPPH